jgi:integrase
VSPFKDPERFREYRRQWYADRRQQWLAENGPCLCGSWEDLQLISAKGQKPKGIWSWSASRLAAELHGCRIVCWRCRARPVPAGRAVVSPTVPNRRRRPSRDGIGAGMPRACIRQRPEVDEAGDPLWTGLAAVGLSKRTIHSYLRVVWTADEWFRSRGWSLERATVAQVVAYADTRPATYSSRAMLRCTLKHFWRVVGHPTPPVTAIRCPPAPKMVCRAPSEDDARILAKAVRARGDHRGLAVLFGMYGGLRRSEIASVRWDAVSDDGWLTVVGKGARTRTIPLHPVLLEALDAAPRHGEYVFPGYQARPANPATVWGWVRTVCIDAGLEPLQPHQLRHLALATQNDRTGDLRAVQEFAGHARPETTAGYTRVTAQALRKVVGALDY